MPDCISKQVILRNNQKKEKWEEEGACGSYHLDQALAGIEWQTGATGNSLACKPSMSEHNGHAELVGECGSRPTNPCISHQDGKQNDRADARVAVDAKRRPAFSPLHPARCVGGWRTDPWGEWRGVGHEMKYVQAGCDCPTSVNLSCISSLLPGYTTMKSISMIPWHQSLRLPLGWPACSCTNTL